jgi:hypothetical protein
LRHAGPCSDANVHQAEERGLCCGHAPGIEHSGNFRQHSPLSLPSRYVRYFTYLELTPDLPKPASEKPANLVFWFRNERKTLVSTYLSRCFLIALAFVIGIATIVEARAVEYNSLLLTHTAATEIVPHNKSPSLQFIPTSPRTLYVRQAEHKFERTHAGGDSDNTIRTTSLRGLF